MQSARTTTRDLADVLTERGLCEPTWIVGSRLSDGTLILDIEGVGWWRPSDAQNLFGHTKACLKLGGFAGDVATPTGCKVIRGFFFPENVEILELSVVEVDQTVWGRAPFSRIDCTSPIPDPFAILAIADTFMDAANCPYPTLDFVFNEVRVADLRKRLMQSTCVIASVSEALRAVICNELERQNVRYTCTHTPRRPVGNFLLIQINDMALFSRTAEITFGI